MDYIIGVLISALLAMFCLLMGARSRICSTAERVERVQLTLDNVDRVLGVLTRDVKGLSVKEYQDKLLTLASRRVNEAWRSLDFEFDKETARGAIRRLQMDVLNNNAEIERLILKNCKPLPPGPFGEHDQPWM